MKATYGPTRLACLKFLLRPIVRFHLRGANGIQEFTDILKSVFVEIASEELEKAGERVNVSRISVFTGVHRPEVKKIYEEGIEPERATDRVVSKVIGQWEQNKRFQTSSGKPKVLDLTGQPSEFRQLVLSIDTSVAPGTVQFELERIGAVKRTKHGLKLLKSVERLQTVPKKAFELLGQDMEALVEAVEENVASGEKIRNLHVRTEYDDVYQADIPKIKAWLKKEGEKFHKRARSFISRHDKEINFKSDKEAGAKVILGSFSLTNANHED